MHELRRFLSLPWPELAMPLRVLVAALGVAGLIAVGMWLQHHGWPDTPSATANLFTLPLAFLAISSGFAGAIAGSLAVTVTLFVMGDTHLSAIDFQLHCTNFAAVALVVAAFAHLQGYYQRRLFHATMHDSGTGLPGRIALWRALDRQLAEREHGVPQNSLVVIMLDNLQDITATFGYEAADELIVQLWQRLVVVFHPGACVFHYRRDCLAVLFHDPDDDLDTLMGKLMTHFETSMPYEGVPIHFTSLFGFVRLNGKDRRNVITQAEATIEAARERDVQGLIYTSGMERERKRSLTLLGDLQMARRDGSLTMHYQPKVRLATMELDGFEALARWEHPTLGSISPAEFIPIVERTECIHPFSVWAAEHVLNAVHEHWANAKERLSFAINISSHNLMNPDFPEQIRTLLEEYGLPSGGFELEVTEGEIMKNPEQAIEVLQQLADIRIVISIDDFGTGYSSLAYLHRLPATTIKIDRGFINRMNGSDGVREIVSAAIHLAHALDMQVVAEGIETAEQLETLRQLGCDLGQGFFFSPAMPADAAARWQPMSDFPANRP